MKLMYGYLFIDDYGTKIELSNKEALLLECLQQNNVVTPKIIFEYVYKDDFDKYDESLNGSIKTLVCRLRKKLKGTINIYTKYNIGYFLDENTSIDLVNNEIYRG